MNAKEWAERLHGREYLKEMNAGDVMRATADGMVVVYGQSDDLIEFRGVVDCEGGAKGGALYRLAPNKEAVREHHGRNPAGDFLTDEQWKALPEIIVVNDPHNIPAATWDITTAIPHHTFDIMENGEIYCRGIVFAWADAFPKKEEEADESLYPVDRPVGPSNRWESPEQWADIADWEENRADRAEKALKEVCDLVRKEFGALEGGSDTIDRVCKAIMGGK